MCQIRPAVPATWGFGTAGRLLGDYDLSVTTSTDRGADLTAHEGLRAQKKR
jgi:hypothetical protein